jgi:hypothetical protein
MLKKYFPAVSAFVRSSSTQGRSILSTSEEDEGSKESMEPDHDEDKDQLENETGELKEEKTINRLF